MTCSAIAKRRLLFCAASFSILLHFAVRAQTRIIPQPLKIEQQKGYFLLKDHMTIWIAGGSSNTTGIYLKDYLAKYYGIHINLTNKKWTFPIVMSYEGAWGKGGYQMDISAKGINIQGDHDGVFYAVQSLIQLLPASGPLKIPACTIKDSPRFGWRGLSIDVSRHFFTVPEVKKYIDMMAHYKLNVLHWHLTDDEGWRIQIDKYPLLTEVGSRIGYYEQQGKFRKLDNLVDHGRDGFYTKDDIREVLKYAEERHVTILPEIEMPGHSEAAIFAYPWLGCKDSTGAKHRVRMLDPGDSTFTFMQNVLTEVIDLFPNQYIHIGGDEAEMIDWLKSPTAVALMKKEGLKNEREVQSYFIKRIEKFLLSENKKLIGWDEILQGGLAESATVMSWQGEAGGIAAAKMHHPVVMTPLPYMYFDAPQGSEQMEPIGWNPPVAWQMVYNYEPVSKKLTADEAEYILGIQGNVWAEKIPNMRHLEYMIYPRALAVAELGWTAKENKNIDSFADRLTRQYDLFRLWDLNAHLPGVENMADVVTNADHYSFALNYPLPGAKVRYTINSKGPDSLARTFNFPVKLDTALTDSLRLTTYTTWAPGHWHVSQRETIKHVVINALNDAGAVKPGLSYALYKTREGNYRKLDTLHPTVTGPYSQPQTFVFMPNDPLNNWVRVDGFLKIEQEGDYQLTTGFISSPLILLNDVPVINLDRDGYVEPQKALLHLKKGFYALKGYYLADENNYGETLMQLKSSEGKVLDPATYWYHL